MPDPMPQLVAGPDLTTAQFHDLVKLRIDIFVVEQACPYHEVDGRDLEPTTEHLWRTDETGITVALRILADPEGRRVGRVVTRADARGNGLAGQLLQTAIEHIGPTASVLDAQSHLESFYARQGYVVTGPEFLEDGIPHLPMKRDAL